VRTRSTLAGSLACLLVVCGTADAQPRGWEVRVPARVELEASVTEMLPITIAVDRGLAVSRDAPVIVDLAAGPGVTLKKPRLGRGDAVDPGADAPRFAVPVRGDEAGEVMVKVRVRLWLCGGKVCRPVEDRRQVTIAVTAP
jgi:hypothetical protein